MKLLIVTVVEEYHDAILKLFKKEQLKNLGSFIVGFALLFIGLQFLKEAMPDIKNNPELLEF